VILAPRDQLEALGHQGSLDYLELMDPRDRKVLEDHRDLWVLLDKMEHRVPLETPGVRDQKEIEVVLDCKDL